MAGVAVVGHKIKDTYKNQSYTQRWYDSCKYYDPELGCEGGYEYDTGYHDKIVSGYVKNGSSNVFANGVSICFNGSSTQEECRWSGTPPYYYSGGNLHSSATGSVTSGNSRNVYVNGRSVAIKGSSVNNHESQSTMIDEGSSNVFIGDN